MHCGDARPEILSRSPRLTPRRCRVSQRQCLAPTLWSLWLLRRTRDSSASEPWSNRPRGQFRSSGWERVPTLRSRRAMGTGLSRSASTFRTSSLPSWVSVSPSGRGASRTASPTPRARIRPALPQLSRTRNSNSVARSPKPPPDSKRHSGALRSWSTASCPPLGGRSAMKRIAIALLLVAVTVSGCRKKAPTVSKTTDINDMAGMPGMAAAGTDTSGVPVNRTEAQRLGITFARASDRPIQSSVRAVGVLNYAEPNRAYVNARVGGWVEHLHADYVGKRVERGEPLLALYSPDLVSAQEEYLLARRLKDDTLAAGARRRLELWDIGADQIDSLEARGTATRTLLLRAPRAGEIVEKMVTDGQAVKPGDNLFLIADRRVLWVDVAVFERDASAVRVGMRATVRVDAVPGATFDGRLTFIQPQLDERTRTLTARLEVDNASGALRPGMKSSRRPPSCSIPSPIWLRQSRA